MLAQPLQPQEPSRSANHQVFPASHSKDVATELQLARNEPVYADVMGQFLQLFTYNHGVALFELDESVPRETIVKEFEEAAAKILEVVPWLGYRVILDGVCAGSSGRFRSAVWPGDSPTRNFVRFKDCTQLCPSYDELLAAQAPTKMLEGALLCPVPGFPTPYDVAKHGDPPVFLVQVSFVKGGALVNFSNQHNVMDGTALFRVITLLASVMCGEEVPADVIEQANRDPAKVVPLYSPNDVIRDHNWLKATARPLPTMSSPRPAHWRMLRFSRKIAQQVKTIASDPIGYDPAVPFISSEDAVISLYWKCLANFRVKDGVDRTRSSRMLRAIDSRGVLKISHSYMGQLVYYSRTFLTLKELMTLPLSTIACNMRRNLLNDNTEFSVRSYATWLSGVPDKSTLIYCGPADRTIDVSLLRTIAIGRLYSRYRKVSRGSLARKDLGSRYVTS
ncbi:hypothetical protein LTR24_002509 [Lithohypha guttulata]|uniref:Trichothecene 3-O-acetyltransferase-like N-terminal domain-containing protein n=1 Tax=Lithohypha guttulata TaxID=1690604 RepID=A0ABR0KHP0_9EURO|nr:hypothetical protein LTR24_002509 [Lithohypha guttulata]